MRALEALTLLVLLAALPILAIPRLRRHPWAKYVPLATPIMAIAQATIEGPRWQMAPAYTLAIGFGLVGLLALRFHPRKRITLIATIVGLTFAIPILILAIGLPAFFPVFHFPKPTGPYAIGTLTYHWTDTSRPELFTASPTDHRQLFAQVWYPAPATSKGTRAHYVDTTGTWAADTAHLLGFPGFLFDHFKYVTTNAITAAPIATDHQQYPVLIYQPGRNGFRSVSNFQVEELVSHGYIVVGLDQPGAVSSVTFPDGTHILGWPKTEGDTYIDQAIWPSSKPPILNGTLLPDGISPYFGQDASFALDQLTALNTTDPNHTLAGHLDLAHAGTFGVSLGGMDVAETCAKDSRFKACLIMDVYLPHKVVQSGLQQPTMFISRDAGTMRLERARSGGWTERDIQTTLDTMRSVYSRLPGDGYYVEIPTMFHVNFTDLPYWLPLSTPLGLTGPINAQRGFDITNAYSLAFFDRELKGKSPSLLAEPHHFSEATLQTKSRVEETVRQ